MMDLIQLLYLMQKNSEKISPLEYEKLRKYCQGMMQTYVDDPDLLPTYLKMTEWILKRRIKDIDGQDLPAVIRAKLMKWNVPVLKDFIRKFSKPYRKAVKLKNKKKL